jgi:hypothetical protein
MIVLMLSTWLRQMTAERFSPQADIGQSSFWADKTL